ncbi:MULTISPECIES: Ulp1 family isopeptidase [unclassified Bradyrhizobium]
MDFAKRSRPSEADLELIEEFKTALVSANRPTKTIENHETALRWFSEFLQSKGVILKDLLGNPDLLAAYKAEFTKQASANSSSRVGGALDALRHFHARNFLSAPDWVGRQYEPMYPSDELMIGQFVKNVQDYRIEPDGTRGRGTGKVPTRTITSNVQPLTTFAQWLRAHNKGPLADYAFNEPSRLAAMVDEYVDAGGDEDDKLSVALSHLRRIGANELEAVGAGPRLMGRETLGAYQQDRTAIDGFLTHAMSNYASKVASQMATNLRRFSDWLQREGKLGIMDRIDGDVEQQSSLNADYAAFRKATKRTAPLNSFREYLGLEPQFRFRPHDDDASLIQGFADEMLRNPDSKRTSLTKVATAQRGLSHWLRQEGKESIASRMNGNEEQQRSLAADLQAFIEAKGKDAAFRLRLNKLKQYAQVVDANRMLGVNLPQQRADSDSISTWMRNLPTPPSESEWPPVLGPYGQAGLQEPAGSNSTSSWIRNLPTPPSESEWPPMVGPFGQAGLQEPAGSSSTWSPQLPSYFDFPTPKGEPARSSDIYRGLGSLVDLPSTPQDMRDDAQSGPVLSPAGRPPFFIGPSGMHQELEDIGYLVGENWQHGSQPVPDFLLDVLDNKMLLPSSRMAPQPVSINGETYSITLGPRGRRDAQLIHHPGPSSVPKARVGGSAASASAGDRSGRVLGARDWLGDEHIQRDYELLAQELSASNPNLAARTRFVDPLVAFQVGQGTGDVALTALHRIVNDRHDNDTADFLFLPVSDASTTDLHDRGSHWSLLLVDRRDRDNPVAHHYDSARGYNDRPAAMLAARVGAGDNLLAATISQQRNGYDCGVFVADGTRALVRRLAGRRQADLSLANLVIDRQALQNRLRG